MLALETSTHRGSVALVESGRLLAESWHDEPHAHGERLLGLIDDTFNRAKRTLSQIERVAAGRGPGAFTGLRVGLALAQGIATGLGVSAVGVGSMRAMALGLEPETGGRRWPILDARRGELFLACYDEDGAELVAPRAVARIRLPEALLQLRSTLCPPGADDWLLGNVVTELGQLDADLPGFRSRSGDATDWPSAAAVGRWASMTEHPSPVSPEYLREADAILPTLPLSPLAQPRTY